MDLKAIKKPAAPASSRQQKLFEQFENLLSELSKKDIPEDILILLNKHIEELNAEVDTSRKPYRAIKKKQSIIIKSVEKSLKIVPKHFYRTTWMAIGMAAFGIPMGAAFGASMGNMSLLAMGIPIGMAVGMTVGAGMDKKAFNEGRQMDIEIKY